MRRSRSRVPLQPLPPCTCGGAGRARTLAVGTSAAERRGAVAQQPAAGPDDDAVLCCVACAAADAAGCAASPRLARRLQQSVQLQLPAPAACELRLCGADAGERTLRCGARAAAAARRCALPPAAARRHARPNENETALVPRLRVLSRRAFRACRGAPLSRAAGGSPRALPRRGCRLLLPPARRATLLSSSRESGAAARRHVEGRRAQWCTRDRVTWPRGWCW